MADPTVSNAQRQVLRLGLLMVVVNLLLPLGLVVVAQARGEAWWELLAGEESAVTWFSSVQLLTIAALAWWNYRVGGLVAAGFLLFDLRRRPLALGLFAAAALLAGTSVVVEQVRGEIIVGWALWAELLVLLSLLVVLRDRLDEVGRQGKGAALVAAVGRDVPRFALLLIAVNVTLPLGYLVRIAFTGESFYEMFWYESDAVSWFSSVQLLIVGLSAYAVHEISKSRAWIWLVFAAGFVFLALDERFEWHEAIRDRVAGPAGVGSLPGLRAGDVGLLLYLAIGLVFAWWLWKELRDNRVARSLFIAALVLSAAIVFEDALREDVRDSLPFPGFWDSAFEEIGEIWAQLCFCLSFLTIFRERLTR